MGSHIGAKHGNPQNSDCQTHDVSDFLMFLQQGVTPQYARFWHIMCCHSQPSLPIYTLVAYLYSFKHSNHFNNSLGGTHLQECQQHSWGQQPLSFPVELQKFQPLSQFTGRNAPQRTPAETPWGQQQSLHPLCVDCRHSKQLCIWCTRPGVPARRSTPGSYQQQQQILDQPAAWSDHW